MERTPVNLLWTGGADSTYRLLDLVLVQGRNVQPYYVISHGRVSAPTEMAAMDKIRGALVGRGVGHLVRPTIVFARSEIGPCPEITGASERLVAKGLAGDQYEWLARCAKQHSIKDLELSIHREERGRPTNPFNLLKDSVYQDGDAARLVENPEREDLKLFSAFRFPLFQLSKNEMRAKAAAAGFADIMEMTWFCHHPRRGRACGTCNPCRYSISEGMGHRVPWINRVRYTLLPVRPLVRALRKRLARVAAHLTVRPALSSAARTGRPPKSQDQSGDREWRWPKTVARRGRTGDNPQPWSGIR